MDKTNMKHRMDQSKYEQVFEPMGKSLEHKEKQRDKLKALKTQSTNKRENDGQLLKIKPYIGDHTNYK